MFRNQVLSNAALEVFSHIVNKTKACFVQFVQFEKKTSSAAKQGTKRLKIIATVRKNMTYRHAKCASTHDMKS